MEVNNRWGVIYCPKEGSRNTERRWEKIRRYMLEVGLQFDYVQSEGLGSVERLAEMMATNGYRTVIVVGGDAALNDLVNGIMRSGARPAIGVIPNGHGNDFAQYWGFDADNYKKTIRQMILRKTRKIDVGKGDYMHKDEHFTRYFINCVNVGLAAAIISIKRKTQRFWGWQTLSYLSSYFLMLFERMDFRMEFSLNNEHVCRRFMTVCIGSATGYGQTPSAVPYNGLLDVSAVSHPRLWQLANGLRMLSNRRFLGHEDVKSWRTDKISFTDTGHAKVSFDGRVSHFPIESLNISIQQEVLDFIIP